MPNDVADVHREQGDEQECAEDMDHHKQVTDPSDDPGRAGAIKLRGVYHLTPVDKGGQVVKVEDIKERDIMSAPKLDTDPTDAHTNHASI